MVSGKTVNRAYDTKHDNGKASSFKPGAFWGGPPEGDPRAPRGPGDPLRGGPPQICPYRPLISYKIGQMPTVTRGG